MLVFVHSNIYTSIDEQIGRTVCNLRAELKCSCISNTTKQFVVITKTTETNSLNTYWRKEFYLLFNCVANQEKGFKNLYFVNSIHETKE